MILDEKSRVQICTDSGIPMWKCARRFTGVVVFFFFNVFVFIYISQTSLYRPAIFNLLTSLLPPQAPIS